MFTVYDPDKPPQELPPLVRQAVKIAFAAEVHSHSLTSRDKPAMLLRLFRKPDSDTLQPGLMHLNVTGDARTVVGLVEPPPGKYWPNRHQGAIIACDTWTAPPDIGQALLAGVTEAGTRRRLILGVMNDRWSLLMLGRDVGERAECRVAPPEEYGEFGDDVTEMADVLTAYNQRFTVTHR